MKIGEKITRPLFQPVLMGLIFCVSISTPLWGTDAVSGKIFKVDVSKRCFEILKETEYDPKTAIGQSRFTFHWTDKTVFCKDDEPKSFAGIGKRTVVKFRGIDNANVKNLSAGQAFISRTATVLGGTTEAPGLNLTNNQVTAWFTPDAGEAPRSGRIEIDGKSIAVSLRDKNWQISRHQTIQPGELSNGFWQATLVAHDDNGQTIVDSIHATQLPDPRINDDPKLPRVLVIGDSISMNYHESAKAALAGIANYHRNEGNCFSTEHGVRNTELWLGNYHEKGFHWDVIQFNHGLHDLKQTYDAKTDTWGDYAVPLANYKANLEKEIAMLSKTGAKLIWCTTTPVPNDNKSTYARHKGASKIFNDAALEVMHRHPEILITDLHAVVEGSPVFDNWRKTVDVHFYQKEEQQLLGQAVANTVRKALEKPVK
ncbi:MAG: SGNH/GDSL hydrolase family protein [Verrucomicrobiota bacterium]